MAPVRAMKRVLRIIFYVVLWRALSVIVQSDESIDYNALCCFLHKPSYFSLYFCVCRRSNNEDVDTMFVVLLCNDAVFSQHVYLMYDASEELLEATLRSKSFERWIAKIRN